MKTTAVETLAITSDAFKDQEHIPSLYTCEGRNINPPLRIGNIPENAQSLAMIVDDPDAPRGTFTHWVVWNIPVKSSIGENSAPGGIQGLNDYDTPVYMGPCPPSGTHRYFFKVYALDTMLDLDINSKKAALEQAMKDHVLAYGELTGLYQKKNLS